MINAAESQPGTLPTVCRWEKVMPGGEFLHPGLPTPPHGGESWCEEPAPNRCAALPPEHVLLQPSWFCSQPAPSACIKAVSRSELLLASRPPVGLSLSPPPSPAPARSPTPAPGRSPSLAAALPGPWQIRKKPAGQIGTNETEQEGGEGR